MHTLPKILALNFMGCLWGYIGMMLIRRGLPTFFLEYSFIGAFTLTLISLVIGHFKGRFVLKKTADRLIERLDKVRGYLSLFKILDIKFLILMGCMMGLSLALKALPGLLVFKGLLRTAVGVALLQSSFYFFKFSFTSPISNVHR